MHQSPEEVFNRILDSVDNLEAERQEFPEFFLIVEKTQPKHNVVYGTTVYFNIQFFFLTFLVQRVFTEES